MKEISEKMVLEGIDPVDLIAGIEEAVDKGSISLVQEYLLLFSVACFKAKHEERFPNDVFKAIVVQMLRPEFQRLPDASSLILLFEYDWGRLTYLQKDQLPDVISKTFAGFSERLAHFVLAEILGEYCASEAALVVIEKLIKSDDEHARASLTYGLRKLARWTVDDGVRSRAVVKLKQLTNDPSELVRDEAFIGLSGRSADLE